MTPPGIVLTIAAALSVGGQPVATAKIDMVTLRPGFEHVRVYATAPDKQYTDPQTGKRYSWSDPNLAGVRVRFRQCIGQSEETFEGVRLADGRMFVN